MARAIQAILRRMARLENQAVRTQQRILRATRTDILRAIGATDPQAFRAFHLGELLGAIDRQIAQHRATSIDAVGQATRGAVDLGRRQVDRVLQAVGIESSLIGTSPELVSAVVDVTTDQVRAVWSELGTKLKATVRRAALGVDDPFKAMGEVAKMIRDPKTFGSAAMRAEAIVRTEVNRTFTVSTQDRMRQSDRRLGGGLKKTWLTSHDARVRAAHIQAGKDYAPDGDPGPIPVNAPFIVDGEPLMFPLDPRGSPENVIQCRCVSVPYTEDLEEAFIAPWRERELVLV